MDPISASCFSLQFQENEKAIIEEQKQEEKFKEIIVSCCSLTQYEKRSIKCLLPQIFATVIAASFHIVVGIALAFSAILIPQLKEDESFPMTVQESSWIASIIAVVVPVGAVAGGFVMDIIGRLNTVKLASIPGVIGWVLIAMATDVPMLIAGRLFTGLAAALGTSPAIVYITEIARADMRGSLISFAPAYASMGMVLTFLKGWFFDWRVVAWTCNFYTIVPCVLIMFIPESPAWLVSKGRHEQALHSLAWINKYQPQPENKAFTLAEMQLQLLKKEHEKKLAESMHGHGAMYKARAFLKPTGFKPLIILIGLFFFQQFSGIYITLFYSVSFFKAVGSTMNAYLASTLIGTVRLIMSIVDTYLLRTFNRRSLIVTSALGMAICMLVSGLFTQWIQDGTTTMTWVPVAALLCYVITSMIGLLPIPWTMTAELFPIEIRGVAHSIAYSAANLLMFASVQSYESLMVLLGGASKIQYFFALICLIAVVFVIVFLPETHRKKLKEIEEYFNHNTVYLGSKKKAIAHAQQAKGDKSGSYVRVPKKDIVKATNGGPNEKLIQEA